jgi:hypothetical protein
LLVVGFGEDGARRRVFEDELVRALCAAGVDAVLSTRFVGIKKRMHIHPAQPVFVPSISYRRGFYGYYSALVMAPPTIYQYELVVSETILWNAQLDVLVWSGASESHSLADAQMGDFELAVRTVVATRRRQGLL